MPLGTSHRVPMPSRQMGRKTRRRPPEPPRSPEPLRSTASLTQPPSRRLTGTPTLLPWPSDSPPSRESRGTRQQPSSTLPAARSSMPPVTTPCSCRPPTSRSSPWRACSACATPARDSPPPSSARPPERSSWWVGETPISSAPRVRMAAPGPPPSSLPDVPRRR